MAKSPLIRNIGQTGRAVGSVASVLGLFAGRKSAKLVKASADHRALLIDREAEELRAFSGTPVGIAQVKARNIQRTKRFAQSANQAAAAASGAQGPTVTTLDIDIEEQGTQSALEALALGLSQREQMLAQADALNLQAEFTRAEGRAGRRAAESSALNTFLAGSGRTLAEKYGDPDDPDDPTSPTTGPSPSQLIAPSEIDFFEI